MLRRSTPPEPISNLSYPPPFHPTAMPLVYATLFAALTGLVGAATYSISDTIVGTDFYSAFTFEAIADPTNGRV